MQGIRNRNKRQQRLGSKVQEKDDVLRQGKAGASASTPGKSVLVVFNAGAKVYGLERGVIEIFDLLRPEVDSSFLMSLTTSRLNLPILQEIKARRLDHSFFSDTREWPRIGKPRSLGDAWRMLVAVVKGNIDVMKAAKGRDVIYIPGLNYLYLALIAAAVYRFLGRTVIFHFHDLINKPSTKLRFASLFISDFVHNAKVGLDTTLRTSPYLKTKRHHIIPYPIREAIEEVEQPDGWSGNGTRNILFVGQVSPHKGVDVLLDAFEHIRISHPDVVLSIVGSCDDPLLSDRLTAAACAGRNIKWWGYQADITPFLKRAYMCVQPSPPSRFHESFGIGLVEAMAAGVPCVCFHSGAFAEIMIHEQTGVVCESEDPIALSRSIESLLRDREFRDRCGQAALQHYRLNFSQSMIKGSWLRTLEVNS